MDLGLASNSVPEDVRLGIDGARNIRIIARTYREHLWSLYKFTIIRAGVAVELMRLCGLERKGFFEMWAEVFLREQRIGYIWLEQGTPDPWEEKGGGVENGTVGS